MTRTPRPSPPSRANLTDTEKRAAIARLIELVKAIQAFEIGTIQSGSDPKVTALETRIQQTLSSIYGPQSHEYRALSSASNLKPVFRGPLYIGMGRQPPGPSTADVQQGIAERCATAAAMLTEAARSLQEELRPPPEDAGARPLRAYAEMDLHRAIDDAAGQLYRDGHFANAIEDAVKALNNLVRLRSGKDVDGEALMTSVFNPKSPILRFNDLRDASDQDEQRGFMMMFAGAVAGLRNPRAHKLIKDDPERALEFIAFVSLLAKLVDGAKKSPPGP